MNIATDFWCHGDSRISYFGANSLGMRIAFPTCTVVSVLKGIAAMANEDLTQFEGLLGQLMAPDNNTRQLAEVRTLVFYTCIDLLHLIGNFGLD